MDWLRCKVGGWLYFMGYRVLPPRVRERISQINAIGLEWINHDFPKRFEINMED